MRAFSKVLSLTFFAILFVVSPLFVSAAEDVKPYLVTKENGPWFISVYVFTDINSELAADQAVRLTRELRDVFRLPAYIYVKESGEGKTMEGRPYYVVDPNNPDAKPQISTTYHYLNPSASKEFAVLVGNFASVEDPRAAKALAQIKTLQPKCLANTPSRNPADPENRQPLSRAFMTSNPLLPREFFVSPGLDPVVLAANKDIKRYSLLDCPGKYTVQVAVLKGVTTLNQQRIAEIQANDAKGLSIKGQTLSDADEKAILLCEGLRAKGYEAYVFRDRYASIVTIGSFDFVGNEVNGQFTFRPEILQIIKTFSAGTDPTQAGIASIKRKSLAEIPGGKAPKKEAAGILFDPMPRVVQAPKRPVLK
ncbi:MAG: hypothetical protein K6C40_10380 [Thermoguttaceae bacterium]|nr:hypothetical protein [Thermoguttaceae bacterium]